MTGINNIDTTKFFESHAHYDDKSFDDDRTELFEQLKTSCEYVVTTCSDMDRLPLNLELCKKYDFLYLTAGIYPQSAKNATESDFDAVKSVCDYDKFVAVGEIGLDYYYGKDDKEVQKDWFKRQIELAKEIKKPIVVHSRQAAADTLEIIKKSGINKGVIHCFSYSPQIAKEFIDLGFLIGIGGVVTFKNSQKLVETVNEISLDNILIETDCPYLSPEPKRGRRNDSRNLKYICKKIAEIKNVSAEEVISRTKQNGRKLLGIRG